jgi:hypothetical protein
MRRIAAIAVASLTLAVTPAAGAQEACPVGAEPGCAVRTAHAEGLIADGTSGGTFGFLLVDIGGPVLAASGPDRSFYPASSIKVLHHLHSVLWVQEQGIEALDTPISVYSDTCAGSGASTSERLGDLLTAMMIRSDNPATNAVQDFFGLDALATTASLAGMTDTAVHHRFGCGGPSNDPANRSTAADLVALYTAVADGSLLDREHRTLFDSYMLDEDSGVLGTALVASAMDAGGSGPPLWALEDRLHVVSKAGWYGPRLSVAGLAEIPTRTGTRVFAFAVWVEPDAVVEGFTVESVAADLLRDPVREAMRSLRTPRYARPLWAAIPI